MSLFSINSPPVGYRFRPTNIELVDHYLKLKNKGHHDQVTIISEVDIYKHDPWELPALSKIETKDYEWYFFCRPNYQRGCRVKRATNTGYWKSTGNDRVIKCGKKEIGRKKSLVFHTGRGSDAKGTHWKIHEYRATEKALDGTDSGQGGFVLCRLFMDEDKKKDDDNESLDCNEDEHTFSPAVEIQSEPVTPTASGRLEKQPARSESCPAEISERIALHTPLIANYTKDKALSIEPDQDLERTLRDFRDPTPPMVSEIFSRLQYSENQGEVSSRPHLTLDSTNYGQSSSFVFQQDDSLGWGSFNAVSADNNCEENETEAEVHLVSGRLVGKIVKDHDENIESLTYGDVQQIFYTAEETPLEPITPIMRSQAELHPTSIESCIADNTENQAVDNTSIQGEVPLGPHLTLDSINHEQISSIVSHHNDSLGWALDTDSAADYNSITGIIRTHQPRDHLNNHNFTMHGTVRRRLHSFSLDSLGWGSFNAVSAADNNSGTGIIRTRQPRNRQRGPRLMNFQVDSINRGMPEDLSNALENCEEKQTKAEGPITPIMSTQAEMHPSSMENSIADGTESRALDDAYIQFECCTNALAINECFEPNIVNSNDQSYQDSGNHKISTVESETPNRINTTESLSVKEDGLCNESDVAMSQGKVALAAISSPDINTGTGIIRRARQPRDQENDQSFSAHGNAPRRLRLQMKLQVSSTYCSLPKDLSYNEDSCEVRQKPIEGENATFGEVARELSFPTRMVAKAPPALRLLVIIIFFTVFIGAWGYFKIFVS